MKRLSEEEDEGEQRYESLCWLTAAVLCFNLGSFFFGYSMVYFNSIDYEIIADIFDIQMERGRGEGLLSGCIAFGAFFGAFSSIKVLQIFSRK